MPNKRSFILFIFILFCNTYSFAAFPIKTQQVNVISTNTADVAATTSDQSSQSVQKSRWARFLDRFHDDDDNYHHHRKPQKPKRLGRAILLCCLCFYPYILGLHRFYLGYIGDGVAQLLGDAAFILGVIVLISSPDMPFLGGALLVYAGVMLLWQLVDLIRLIFGNLKPKYSYYIRHNRNRSGAYPRHVD